MQNDTVNYLQRKISIVGELRSLPGQIFLFHYLILTVRQTEIKQLFLGFLI